eukprot:GHVU01117020.1.p1 GENE.GHVU01117020.1~~GHVU01117020.1.p1  ORF type:complete len:941 (+),score=164.98 GHVU01117020.1:246-3068(+)
MDPRTNIFTTRMRGELQQLQECRLEGVSWHVSEDLRVAAAVGGELGRHRLPSSYDDMNGQRKNVPTVDRATEEEMVSGSDADTNSPRGPSKRGDKYLKLFYSYDFVFGKEMGAALLREQQDCRRRQRQWENCGEDTVTTGGANAAGESSDVAAAEFLLEVYDDFPFSPPHVACIRVGHPRLEAMYLRLLRTSPSRVAGLALGTSWLPPVTIARFVAALGEYLRDEAAAATVEGAALPGYDDDPLSLNLFTQGRRGVVFALLLALLLRLAFGVNSYSGENQPPEYGDYEAQRHWQELCLNLPPTEWYRDTAMNNRSYWPLDYPPLSGYHSYALGVVARRVVDPASVALTPESRGYESPPHRLFMRASVLLADVAFFFSAAAAYWFCRRLPNATGATAIGRDGGGGGLGSPTPMDLLLTLSVPGFVVIDHGHFQYNCVALGLVLWALVSFERRRDSLGAICFSLAVLYKQTTLYFAPAVFCYLLGRCVFTADRRGMLHRTLRLRRPSVSVSRMLSLAAAVATVIGLVLLPVLVPLSAGTDAASAFHSEAEGGRKQLEEPTGTGTRSASPLLLPVMWANLQALLRALFPFHRGLFEDYVANVWPLLDVLFKRTGSLGSALHKRTSLSSSSGFEGGLSLGLGDDTGHHHRHSLSLRHLSTHAAAKVAPWSAALTVAALAPACYDVLTRPTTTRLRWALFCSSMSFYLFSAMVHDKGILFPLLPAMLLYADNPRFSHVFVVAASVSLKHLHQKDGHYAAACVCWVSWILLTASRLPTSAAASNYFSCCSTSSAPPPSGGNGPGTHMRNLGGASSSSSAAAPNHGGTNPRSRRLWEESPNSSDLTGPTGRTPTAPPFSVAFTDRLRASIAAAACPLSWGAALLLVLAELALEPPARYPYLHTLVASAACCCCFLALLAYATVRQLQLPVFDSHSFLRMGVEPKKVV